MQKIETFNPIRVLKREDRPNAFSLVRRNLGNPVIHDQILVVPAVIEPHVSADQLQAAADVLENVDGSRRLVWTVDRG